MSLLAAVGMCACGAGYRSVSVAKFRKLISDAEVQLLDVRTESEYEEGHMDGALLADVKRDDFMDVAKSRLDKRRPVAVYCRSGRRSLTACGLLSAEGFTVYNLKTGILGWQDAGLPVVKPDPIENELTKSPVVRPNPKAATSGCGSTENHATGGGL